MKKKDAIDAGVEGNLKGQACLDQCARASTSIPIADGFTNAFRVVRS